MRLNKFNEEVFFADDEIVKLGYQDIDFLKEKAQNNERKRVRLCAHKEVKDTLHEMLIIHMKDTYVRPHKHLHKSESLYVIEGEASAVMFDEAGHIVEVIRIGDYRSGHRFYYRISAPVYHTLLISTEFFVFHETTNGPFNKTDTVFAPWAPEENDSGNVIGYARKIAAEVRRTL